MKWCQIAAQFNISLYIVINKNTFPVIFSSVYNPVTNSLNIGNFFNNSMFRITENLHHHIDTCSVIRNIGNHLIGFSSVGL